MDPKTVLLVEFAESMAALAAKTIVDLKGVLTGNSTSTVDQILADADSNYQAVISKAKQQ